MLQEVWGLSSFTSEPQQQRRNKPDQPVRQQRRVLPAAKGSSDGIYKQKATVKMDLLWIDSF
jgi:hypothetical protein